MIMVSDITRNNVTGRSVPGWMANDNFAVLLNQDERKVSFLSRLHSLLRK